jgi:hypothetical protein
MAACFKCGEAIPEGPDLALDAVCSKCSSYLHSCANCSFYDEYQKNPCRNAQAPFVHDRLTKNACTFFAIKSAGPLSGALVADEPRKFSRPRGGGGGGFKKPSNQRDAHLNKNAPIVPSQSKNAGGNSGGGAGSGGSSSDAKKKLESLFSS